MAILGTTVWRVRPGKTQDFLANAAAAKRILERLGARVRLVNQVVGSLAPAMIFIVESADWRAAGESAGRLRMAGVLRQGDRQQRKPVRRPDWHRVVDGRACGLSRVRASHGHFARG